MVWKNDGKISTWSCPECGRVVQVYPVFKVIEQGNADMHVRHQGSVGGVEFTGVTVQQVEAKP